MDVGTAEEEDAVVVVSSIVLFEALGAPRFAAAAAPPVENLAIAGPGKVYLKPGLKTLGVKIPASLALYPPGNVTVGETLVLAVPVLPSNVSQT